MPARSPRSLSTLTRAITSGLVVAAIAGGIWLIGDHSGTAPSETAPERPPVEEMTKEATRGTEEDPDARRTYEHRRLRDPETGEIPDNVHKKELAACCA